MKKLSFYLLIILLSTTTFSCNSGDDSIGGHFGEDGSKETRFTGSWRAESIVADKEIDFNGDGYATKFLFEEEMASCERSRYWIFSKIGEDKLSFNVYGGESWMKCDKDTRLMWKEWNEGTYFHFTNEEGNVFIVEDTNQTRVKILEFKKDEKLVLNFNRIIDEKDLNITVTLIPSDAPFN